MGMNTRKNKMKARALAVAVPAALAAMYAMPAQAQDEAAAKAPLGSAEVGGISVSRSSAKFGEYNGLNKSGNYLDLRFLLRGGEAYTDPNATRRWQIYGDDLGTTSRSAGADYAEQGRWNLGMKLDQLTHNTSDSYQTPYSGSMGGNSFTLPSFGLAANTRLLSAAQQAQFHTMDISNDRQNTTLNGGYLINRQWSFTADYNRLDQAGAKLQSFGAAAIGGASGERPAILPMPTNYKTDTVNVAMNWLGENGHATLGYYGSFFRDNNNGVTFQTFAGALTTQTMGTAPNNDLHQINLTGGYSLTKTTKIAGGLSYSRNTQNTPYAFDSAMMITPSPTSSLNGSVHNTHADFKVTDQTTRNLALSAGFKYDDRENRTSSNIYNFFAIDGSNRANYPNPTLSVKKEQLELAGDYRLTSAQKVRLAYNHDDTDRKCDNYATGGGGGNPSLNPYAPGTNCVTVPKTKEDKIGALWRMRGSDGVNLNAGYSYSDRKSDRDQNARPPMIGYDGNPTAAGIANSPNGTGISGLNGGEFIGFNPFFEASRKQNAFKAGANVEVTQQLSVGVNGRYTKDNYETSYGLQNGKSWSLNFDGTYVFRENGSFTAYATQQQRSRSMTNDQRSPLSAPTLSSPTALGIPSGGTWTNDMKDQDTTLGVNVKQGGLLNGKLELNGDMTYTYTKTSISTMLNYPSFTTSNPALTCADPSLYTCVPLPDITSNLFQFKVSGTYEVTKDARIRLGYLYQRLVSNDFYYNGLQNGFTPTSVLPTNQVAPNYAVNVFYASYIISF
jgi:MtrB/PioB family decaheme-associated outer membrane protein